MSKITGRQFEKQLAVLKAQAGVSARVDVKLNNEYTGAQKTVFFGTDARRRIIRKGRRLGFTRGCAMYVVEKMLDGTYQKVLWGDTIHQNILNYIERYFKPVLKKLPKSAWRWNKTEKLLIVNGAVCDFRSADKPENWEGFGYDLVVLNEAGIILKNRYLWENAVAPMLLDNPESVAIIGGTPKGKGLFYELWMRGAQNPTATGCCVSEANPQECGMDAAAQGRAFSVSIGCAAEQENALENESVMSSWESFAFSTFDNPHLTKKAIDGLIEELGGTENVVRQEIYGDFIDATTSELFVYSGLLQAMNRTPAVSGREIWGIDVARQGQDQSAIARRRGADIYALKRHDTPDLEDFADLIDNLYSIADTRPEVIFVEIDGLGAGLFDMLRKRKLPVLPANVGGKAPEDRRVKDDKGKPKKTMFNARSAMYKHLADAVSKGCVLPDDKRLLAELAAQEYEIREDGIFKLASKEEIKKTLGYSPDGADACALTYFDENRP